jgi:hypothetical protein
LIENHFHFRNEPSSPQNSSSESKVEKHIINKFDEDDFNPRAYETSSNGMINHALNNNSRNGQISAGTLFTQTNGLNSPPLRKSYFI